MCCWTWLQPPGQCSSSKNCLCQDMSTFPMPPLERRWNATHLSLAIPMYCLGSYLFNTAGFSSCDCRIQMFRTRTALSLTLVCSLGVIALCTVPCCTPRQYIMYSTPPCSKDSVSVCSEAGHLLASELPDRCLSVCGWFAIVDRSITSITALLLHLLMPVDAAFLIASEHGSS